MGRTQVYSRAGTVRRWLPTSELHLDKLRGSQLFSCFSFILLMFLCCWRLNPVLIYILLPVYLFMFLRERVSLSCLDCPHTCDHLARASRIAGLQACFTVPGFPGLCWRERKYVGKLSLGRVFISASPTPASPQNIAITLTSWSSPCVSLSGCTALYTATYIFCLSC